MSWAARHLEFSDLVVGSQPKTLAEGASAPPLDMSALAARSTMFVASPTDVSSDIIFGRNLTWVNFSLLGIQSKVFCIIPEGDNLELDI